MEYTRSKYIGDYNVDETFKGEPEEILTLITELDNGSDEELIYNQNEAVEFIQKQLKGMNKQFINKGFLIAVLDADEDYMRSKGIIED